MTAAEQIVRCETLFRIDRVVVRNRAIIKYSIGL